MKQSDFFAHILHYIFAAINNFCQNNSIVLVFYSII